MRRGVPELVTFVDTEGSISISEEEVPLGAAPKVTKKTTTKTKKKKVRMKKASKRTYSKKLKTRKTTKTTRSKKKTSTVTKKTQTTVSTTERYKKNEADGDHDDRGGQQRFHHKLLRRKRIGIDRRGSQCGSLHFPDRA